MATEYLTMAEIEKRYPNEWVLIDRPQKSKSRSVLGGYVVLHTPDRDEFDQRSLEIDDLSNSIASVYTGEPSPDEVWML
jgi:uncharacterized protein (DUF2252 family)